MNTITNSTKIVSIAFVALILLAIPFAFAKAVGFDLVDVYPDMGGLVDVYPNPGGVDIYPNSYTDIYPNSYTDVYPNSYSYDTFGGFGGSSWMLGGFSGGGFGGGWFIPGTGGGMSQGQSQSQSSTNVNTNTNSCTAGSCNTAINAPTTVTVAGGGSTPVYVPVYTPTYNPPVYTPPTYYPTCNTCGCPGYPACYRPTQQPYVTLASVPYTGLEMGPMGTALYWSFLVLWCLLAAYLIAVKKVQNKVAAWFVGSTPAPARPAYAAPAAPVYTAPVAKAEPVREVGGIDPFIMSQINRPK